jgi:hypothetical protein
MVITAFYVLTSNATAEEYDSSEGGNESNVIDHQLRRLTISDHSASNPTSAVDGNGNVNLIWKQNDDSGVSIKWKISTDGLSSFTPDLKIASSFFSIERLQICSSEDSTILIIAFSGRLNEGDNEGVYVTYTPDGGRSWSDPSLITNGTRPSLVMIGPSAFLGLTHSVDGVPQFSILEMNLDDKNLMMVSV